MKSAIIIHGMPERGDYLARQPALESSQHWIPWLCAALSAQGVAAIAPEMPVPYEPRYSAWKETLEKQRVDKATILIGHSCGAGFLLRWLSEYRGSVAKLLLVAPWMDPKKELATDMFDFAIDPALAQKADEVVLLYSNDDDSEILASAEQITAQLPGIKIMRFAGKGHFTLEDMQTTEFPELLEAALS